MFWEGEKEWGPKKESHETLLHISFMLWQQMLPKWNASEGETLIRPEIHQFCLTYLGLERTMLHIAARQCKQKQKKSQVSWCLSLGSVDLKYFMLQFLIKNGALKHDCHSIFAYIHKILAGFCQPKVFQMRLKNATLKGGFAMENLFYHSVGWLSKDTFGHMRLEREITDAWVGRRFEHAGHKFSTEAPDLTEAELQSIPGAKASMGNLDAMQFEVLERVNDKMVIKSDETKHLHQNSKSVFLVWSILDLFRGFKQFVVFVYYALYFSKKL